jgi:predicted metal-dependent HD superfamily phosphohydrolase
MEARWRQLTSSLTSDVALRDNMFRQLHDAYCGAGRHYHSLDHIRALLDTIDGQAAHLHDAVVVQLAAWFHDAVYSPVASDNEAKSAKIARQFLDQIQFPANRRDRVVYLIERTKDHTQLPPAPDADLYLFLDADLQILGASEPDYWRYARQVRQEYALVPDILYRRGRMQVLRKLLEIPTLYRTPEFQRRLEAKARRNMQAELQAWQTGGL